MKEAAFDRLQALLGPGAVERDSRGLPRAMPESDERLAMLCRAALEESWKIRVEGRSTWLPPDAPANLAVSTRAMGDVLSVSPSDLVATVQAGATLETVRRELADAGMWLALDPPGRQERSIGSIVATGTAGPLRHLYGPVRDHVLGCTVVTGDGRIVKSGGRVVKNVAGYDLTKLQIGGFGGFGIITELHLRLRALPRADATLLARGPRDRLTAGGRDATAAQIGAAALELLSPAVSGEADWVLAARLLGQEAVVAAETRRLQQETSDLVWEPVPADRSGSFWGLAGRAALAGPLTFRVGALLDGLDDTLDLIRDQLNDRLVSAGAGSGAVRWSGEATPEKFRLLRRQLADREIPVTLERAPWELRRVVGHFGAYQEGVGRLVGRLRETFDPGSLLSVALEGAHGD
jgi:glycolate oxidase FAD binding subunit